MVSEHTTSKCRRLWCTPFFVDLFLVIFIVRRRKESEREESGQVGIT